MNSQSGARRFFPGHRNRKSLQKETFATVEGRNRYIIEKRQAGHTLQAIGDSVGLSHEMIRQILVAKGGPTKAEVKVNVERQIRKEVLAAFQERRLIEPGELAAQLSIKPNVIKKALGPKS
jgi:hypothetical protein